jgi:ABC-type branched-subunit amino acid transport system substrate-binding protein
MRRSPHISKQTAVSFIFGIVSVFTSISCIPPETYDPGASESEIKIGHTGPHTGPAAIYGTIGRAIAAYFEKVNASGGVNGRKLKLVSYDDSFDPARTLELTKKLVEEDQVLLIANTLGYAPNAAIQPYLNERGVPQLFVAASFARFSDPARYPWTIAAGTGYQLEAEIYARYVLDSHPNGKIGVLRSDDELGSEYLTGLKRGLGARADMIVSEQTYTPSDARVDAQMVALRDSGADIFMNFSSLAFAVQSIRGAAELGWKPLQFLNLPSAFNAIMLAAGADNGVGVISSATVKDTDDPRWSDDEGVRGWQAWMRDYYPSGDPHDAANAYAYNVAQLLVHVLTRCGDNLTRKNVIRQAASLRGYRGTIMMEGITYDTSPRDYRLSDRTQLLRYNGRFWEQFGPVRDVMGR